MSTNEYLTVVRLPLPDLKKEDALEFFRKHLGEPEEYGEDGENWIYYGSRSEKVGGFRPVFAYDHKPSIWCVDLVLAYSRDYQDTYVSISAATLTNLEKMMQKKFGVKTGAFFISYSWYNGGDEWICAKPDHNIPEKLDAEA